MPASPQFPGLPPHWIEETSICDGIFYRQWVNKNSNGRSGMLLLHGQGEHSGRYSHFPFYLDESLSWIVAPDHIGHGKSLGLRGHVERFFDYSESVLKALAHSQKQAQKVHLFGHSMGGLIALSLMKQNQTSKFASIITSAPVMDLAMPVPPLKKFFGELVAPILGKLQLSNEVPAEAVSRDPLVQQTYAQDPLNHNKVTPRFFVQFSHEMKDLREWQGPAQNSLLMIVPMDDRIACWKTSVEFFKNLQLAPTCTKELHTFPAYFHESFNDFGKERPFIALKNWLDR